MVFPESGEWTLDGLARTRDRAGAWTAWRSMMMENSPAPNPAVLGP
jgi:hypothetical protein